ncbi:DUF4232 domain-containing protein [Streptomyces sioyaensis]|uniref:DUF4232 domain-containing protein n=1 Tax=Streptomyces sioyaensis TaxID=67364 RepID=A0A4Q1R8D2_9ACTN|nr:DUF4232 domain-containing protein [Streptomyces sioyaensis]MBM4793003.1 DUF4232 domain-containing protein [Streptomyces sioyaensis]RXS69620.1 DUF4232 domain-containing protein [Streptomyces sioyaensis]
MRTSRMRTATLAAVTAALALGLTACGGADGGSKAAGGDNAAGTAQSRSASHGDGKGGAEQVDIGGHSTAGARPTTASGGTDEVASGGTTAGAQQCRGDEMLLTAVHRFAGQQGDHLLVTASNKGTKPCWVTSYPAVKLGDVDGAALPHSKKDNPGGDQHLTLRPGGTVYSAVNLFDYGSKHHTAQSFALALRGADGHDGPFYSVSLKGEKPQFSWNEADVLNWNTKKPYDF